MAVASLGLVFALALLAGCGAEAPGPGGEVWLERPWSEVEEAARGSHVTWAMWQGDPYINEYVQGWVAPRLRERYGIELDTVSAVGPEIVAMLMTEAEAGKATSEIDVVWINGENFYQLRQIDALLGPFTEGLPNASGIDWDNPFIAHDFQQPTDGYECPWGNVQLALIHDTERVPVPPRTPEELEAWVRAHPGRFTFDTEFTGMTFLKSLLVHFAGGPGTMDGPFEEARYERAAAKLWDYLERIRPYLWKQGETFPERLSQLHQLFVAGELDFTMSNNDGEVDNKVLQGLFPASTRAFVLESGTIQNSHYLGIPRRAGHVPAALVLVNFLISPEAQFEKLKPAVWGDGSVLDTTLLSEPWPERFANVPGRIHAPPRHELQPFALEEPASETMIRIHRDFRARIVNR